MVQGRDVWVEETPARVREVLASEPYDVPARFRLYNGDGDVLVDAAHVGAIFVPSDHVAPGESWPS